MNATTIGLIVRHIITGLGSVLVADGITDADGINAIAGGLSVIAGLLWSWFQKKGKTTV